VDVLIFGILADEWREHRVGLRRSLSRATILALGHEPAGSFSWPDVAPPG
jgi:hypothetical protein